MNMILDAIAFALWAGSFIALHFMIVLIAGFAAIAALKAATRFVNQVNPFSSED